jgi:hypothetical protein
MLEKIGTCKGHHSTMFLKNICKKDGGNNFVALKKYPELRVKTMQSDNCVKCNRTEAENS